MNQKLVREQTRHSKMIEKIKDKEKNLLKREEELTKVTQELEKRNEKMQRQKIWEREKKGEIEIWKSEIVKDEGALTSMRLQVARRKEIVSKKEINILEWSRRNF